MAQKRDQTAAMTHQSLGDEIFSAYAAGTLSAPMQLLLDTQSRFDSEVALGRSQADAVAGLMLETAPPAAMGEDALAQVLAVIDAEEAGAGEAGPRDAASGDEKGRKAARLASKALEELLSLPVPVRDMALESGANWQFAGPGVRVMELIRQGAAKAELIRLEPGHGVPRHSHDCKEFTLVLCGAFHDGLARYGKGDLSVADPEIEHRPVAEPGEVCIALAVTEGPLAFTGPLGWVQRALGGMN